MSAVQLRRGDVVVVELSSTGGSQQSGSSTPAGSRSLHSRGQKDTRPCLVVQNDVGNENAPTTVVVPFTTSFGEERFPFEVFVRAEEGPLREDSVALCSQLRTVSIEHRVVENLGAVPDDRLPEVDRALQYSLGLAGGP